MGTELASDAALRICWPKEAALAGEMEGSRCTAALIQLGQG